MQVGRGKRDRGGWGESGEAVPVVSPAILLEQAFSHLAPDGSLAFHLQPTTYNLQQAEAWLPEQPCEKELGLDAIRCNRENETDNVLRSIRTRISKLESHTQLGDRGH